MQQILPIVWNTLTESAALYPWYWLDFTGIKPDQLSLIPTNDPTTGEAQYMECSALPDKMGSFCYFQKLCLISFSLKCMCLLWYLLDLQFTILK